MLNTIFTNISVISWLSVLLVEETVEPREYHRKTHLLSEKRSITINNFFCFYKDHETGCHGRDRMVVGFTTTYAIGAYHHKCCDFESVI
jgi:hypothetical protein